jgi:glycosyltransferase involved in cell wall biosynthesis
MRSAHSASTISGTWRTPSYSGLYFDTFAADSAWIRDQAWLRIPPCQGVEQLTLKGEYRPHPEARGIESSPPTLVCLLEGTRVGAFFDLRPGPFDLVIPLSSEVARRGGRLTLQLGGTSLTNTFAWLGRITGWGPLQRFRAQNKNRQLRITTVETNTGEVVFDFALRITPSSPAFARRHARHELNIVGFLTADLGVGESARCMVRAADAAGIATSLVPLKLNCKNRLGDQTYASRLQNENPFRINVVHIDAPASRDIDRHHGESFRAGKYNIAYWAWELPEFPDSWVPNFAYFDEVWCPSDFARKAIAMASPLPVLTMPHAIAFDRPIGNHRAHFKLPVDQFLFLFVCDLNSYSARKNPQAVIAAFRASGLAGNGAVLVIKVQNASENPEDLKLLQAAVRDLPGTVLITGTLTRQEIYQLESTCDCFVSLHRSEGFGLAVAECMYLGKPVISTDWSATAEFVDPTNGCPVRCQVVPIEKTHGPYVKGQLWAEPDIEHAAEWMRRVFNDREFAAVIGSAARHTIEQRFSPAVIGAHYRRRMESIATF